MNKIIFSSFLLLLLISCSSGGSDITPQVNNLESKIVGKTFWRFIVGESANDPNDPSGNSFHYNGHYYGLEFNKNGSIYSRYCSDEIIINDESTLGIDGQFLSKYSFNDSLIYVDYNNADMECETYGFDCSSNLIDLTNSFEYDGYHPILTYCDYIGLDPYNSSWHDYQSTIGFKYDDGNLILTWKFNNNNIFQVDQDSQKQLFDLIFYEALWSEDWPDCTDENTTLILF